MGEERTDQLGAGGWPGTANRPVEIARLSGPTRQRLKELLAGPMLLRARESSGVGIFAAVILYALIGTMVTLLLVFDLGAVDSGRPAHSIIGALCWGLVAAATWWTTAGLLRDLAVIRGGLPGGFHILSDGALQVKGGRILVVNADRIQRHEVRVGAMGELGMALYHIDLVLDDGSKIGTVLFGTEKNVPTEGLDKLVARGAQMRAGRERGGAEAVALVSEDELGSARRGTSPSAGRWWTGPLVAGVAGAAGAYLLLLPQLSLRHARQADWVVVWEAVARTHPLPWIRTASTTAIETTARDVAARLRGRLAPPWDEALAPVFAAAMARPEHGLIVRSVPPDQAAVQAATDKLKALAGPGRQAAPILLARVSTSRLYDDDPAANSFGGKMNDVLKLNESHGVLEIRGERIKLGESYPDVPRIELVYTIEVQSVLSGDGDRVFAGLGLTFSPRAVIPGAAPIPIGQPVSVPAPESMEVLRFNAGDMRRKAMDSTGMAAFDTIEDAQIYVKMIEDSAGKAADQLLAQITR